ncbi:MAG TPA: Na/Pi symporter [Pseudomonadales bacterium]|nr:Na/Pi symporter [Pseudomonadales bacterium]
MTQQLIFDFIGGLGLFLLGMRYMTDGLKLAAGSFLKNLLEHSTRTPLRATFAGFLITALVHSSSAVTIACIGFANAGLLSLKQVTMVTLGANVGTTTTAWLVAFLGINFNIEHFALPSIGLGMALYLLNTERRSGALGQALAGFGVFFLGIHLLKNGFSDLALKIPLTQLNYPGLAGSLVYLGVGILTATLMQSSTASNAISVTAAASGILTLNDAAAMMIGANIGTTSTAALAAINATANARRVAYMHVIFNFSSALLALIMLNQLLQLIIWGRAELGFGDSPGMVLALFDTLFNLIGVILFWPFIDRIVAFLRVRVHGAEEDEARPHYLDKNIASTPALAMNACRLELIRVAQIVHRLCRSATDHIYSHSSKLEIERETLNKLILSIGDFLRQVQRINVVPEKNQQVATLLRISAYYADIADLAEELNGCLQDAGHNLNVELGKAFEENRRLLIGLISHCDVGHSDFSLSALAAALESYNQHYEKSKLAFLEDASVGGLQVTPLVAYIEALTHMHRLARQLEKAARYLASLNTTTPGETA